jgi:hypothetical protein
MTLSALHRSPFFVGMFGRVFHNGASTRQDQVHLRDDGVHEEPRSNHGLVQFTIRSIMQQPRAFLGTQRPGVAFTFQNQVPCGTKGLARRTGESCCKPSLPDDVEHPVKNGSTIQIAELSINGGVNREDVHVVARKDTMTAFAPKMTITTTSTPAEKMQDPDSRYTVFNSYGHCLGRWYMSNTAQHMLEALMLPLNWIKKRLKIWMEWAGSSCNISRRGW